MDQTIHPNPSTLRSSQDPKDLADRFLANSSQFRLGSLTTESNHYLTRDLSELSISNLPRAFQILKEADLLALSTLRKKVQDIFMLSMAISETIDEGGNVYVSGCGSTGRLALTTEFLCRMNANYKIRGFMTGGDAALIRSIESAEDREDLGVEQLKLAGFKNGDMLIAVTEGGETPWVLATAQEAVKSSERQAFCIYCNPDQVLLPVERCRRMIEEPRIHKINLTCGPMAISGSTRMQATTVQLTALMLAIHSAERKDCDSSRITSELDQVIEMVEKLEYQRLAPLTVHESDLYSRKQGIIYQADPDLAIGVLTDTTERAPTFSMRPFEAVGTDNYESLSYLVVKETTDALQAWQTLLGGREPRALEREDLPAASLARLKQFDVSKATLRRRFDQPVFDIDRQDHSIYFEFAGRDLGFNCGDDLFRQHLALKVLLNSHSTLVMGRLGRYMGNVMTWVVATNNKLIDRAIRYSDFLLKREDALPFNIAYDPEQKPEERYRRIAEEIFRQKDIIPADGSVPVVLATVESLKKYR